MNATGTRIALVHPLAVALLIASLAIAAACQWLPPLRAWSWLAGWLVAWGAAGLVVSIFALSWAARLADPVELRELHAIRQALARRLAQQRSQDRDSAAGTWTSILSEAIERIDDDVEPALRELLIRHGSISRHLRLYERGSLPLPDKEIVRRLQTIDLRQRAAIQESVRQASNAEAALLALLEERHDGNVVARARDWTDELLLLHDTLVRALSGDTAAEPRDTLVRALSDDDTAAESREPMLEREPERDNPADRFPVAEYVAATRPSATSISNVARHVEEALRALGNLGALAGSDLIADLPHTLAAARDGVGGAEPTPLEQAQALHRVLRAAIDRLNPTAGPSTADGAVPLGHQILVEEYVLRRSTRSIVVRHFISESTLHRHRNAAIRTLANDLMSHEERLAKGRTNGSAHAAAGGVR